RAGHRRTMKAQPGGLGTKLPLTVLANGETASAAEIVAGALEDNHRATVVGEPTFGTGTVLSTFRLKDGSAILLGTSEWLRPDGQTIKGKGVTPSIAVRLASPGALLTPSLAKHLSPVQLKGSGDSQLLAAIGYLRQHPEVLTSGPTAKG
ncbi:MAG: S41 family peptidase, partial [Chloroflexota bacterium]